MELHPIPCPVKSKYLKPNSSRNTSQAPKPDAKGTTTGPPLHRQKRVFGTARNPNIPLNSVTQKPKPKPEKSTKPSDSERNRARSNKKSVSFQQNNDTGGNNIINNEPQTPVNYKPVGDVGMKPKPPRVSGTPYRSAEKCSKCRFDRLESSAYWLGQIKLSESVGKHFVSAAFFHLAFDCKAEPFRSIRVELKKYLGRHEYLNEEQEWRNLLINYGLVLEKEEEEESKTTLRGKSGFIEDTAIVQENVSAES